MNRRELLAVIGGAAALAPLRATAQPGLPIIGYLSSGSAEAETSPRTAFLEGLEQRGFVVGRNVAIEYRFGEGSSDRLPALAAELAGLPAALLVAYGLDAAMAAKRVTATIPIVFSVAVDPVQRGLVASFNRPAGNATGVYIFGVDLISEAPGIAARGPPAARSDRLSHRSADGHRRRKLKQPPRRSDSPFWFCTLAARMKSRRRSRQWPNARSAVFFTARPRISR